VSISGSTWMSLPPPRMKTGIFKRVPRPRCRTRRARRLSVAVAGFTELRDKLLDLRDLRHRRRIDGAAAWKSSNARAARPSASRRRPREAGERVVFAAFASCSRAGSAACPSSERAADDRYRSPRSSCRRSARPRVAWMPPSLCPRGRRDRSGRRNGEDVRERCQAFLGVRVDRPVRERRTGILAAPGLVEPQTMTPRLPSASASSFPEPFVVCSSGLFQSRSVGPLPASSTSPGNGPVPFGTTRVPESSAANRQRDLLARDLVRRRRHSRAGCTRGASGLHALETSRTTIATRPIHRRTVRSRDREQAIAPG